MPDNNDGKDKNTVQNADELPDPPPRDSIKSKPQDSSRRNVGEMTEKDKPNDREKRDNTRRG